MSMLGAKKRVLEQVRGKDPKGIAYWFLDKSLTLLKETQTPKAEVLKYVEDHYQ